jgi:hypothetical protein
LRTVLPTHEQVIAAKGTSKENEMLRRLRGIEQTRRAGLREVETLIKALGYPV